MPAAGFIPGPPSPRLPQCFQALLRDGDVVELAESVLQDGEATGLFVPPGSKG